MGSAGPFGVFSAFSHEVPSSTPGVDEEGRQTRTRRYHKKTKNGCLKCKSRKVKCDGNRPACRACSLRGEICIFESLHKSPKRLLARTGNRAESNSSSSATSISDAAEDIACHVMAQRRPFPGIHEIDTPADMSKYSRLIHQFEHFTSDTLILGKSFWVYQILPLAFNHDYLLHAILAISASHLNYLLPHASANKRIMEFHLGHTLPGFRKAVGAIASSQDSDVVIACGYLLLYYIWSNPFFNEGGNAHSSADSDGLLWFSTGLKEVITTAYESQSRNKVKGIFQDIGFPQYVRALSGIRSRAKSYICSYNFNEKFLDRDALSTLHDTIRPRGCSEVNIEEWLAPIFYVVDLFSTGFDITDVLPGLMIFSLSWPTKASGEFVSEIRKGDPHALLILLSFYASLWLILPGNAWWARGRCKIMCESILTQLSHNGHPCNENTAEIARYFGFRMNGDGLWEINHEIALRE